MKQAILFAGIAHFGILIASATVPFALDWKESFKALPLLLRQLFWVYGCFIVLTIISFGTIILVNVDALASGGTTLAISVNAVISVFWFARLAVQLFVFDAKPHLTNALYRCGYHTLTIVFIYLAVLHGAAAILGMMPTRPFP